MILKHFFINNNKKSVFVRRFCKKTWGSLGTVLHNGILTDSQEHKKALAFCMLYQVNDAFSHSS